MIKKLYVAMLCMVISSPVLAEDSVYDFNLTSIDYTEMPLEQYHGKAILLVNTASQCGFTPQYEGLQALWENYRDKGLIVLGVPSNDFGGQEPDSEDDIKEFCTINFDVDFPMTKKMVVSGKEGNAAIYDWLAGELGDASRPKWNFHKYLISPEGTPVAYFPSQVTPDSEKLLAAIDAVLK
ncbi:glutathione peroxidase [Kordiimonas pumila]|uniref:Glutathione peroxidase n=1 Tax=Kordiimonas pumila TaxID=2161677 RepID=A0ABV7DA04_9PROT|nr:glutathione peroxidase [Kordiimonas pumila]